MAENCHNCGAELFAGQQFCRRCGASLRAEASEAPTQMLGSGAQTGGTHDPTTASSLPDGGTDPSMRPPPTAPQPPLAGFTRTSPLASAPAVKQRGRWVLPFVLGAGLACVGALLLYMQSEPNTVVIRPGGEGKKMIVGGPVPPMPPEAIEAIKRAARERAGDFASLAPLDEAGAVMSGDETVITKTYPLKAGSSFVVRNANGDVSVEGWDKETAEVRIVKRGGSAEERGGTPVLYGMQGERLTLMTAARPDGPVEVRYEIKVPHGLRQLEINSDDSEVKVSKMGGTVVVDVKKGALEFSDVTGTVRSKIIKGDTKVTYPAAPPGGAQEFSAVRGNVEVDLAERMSADIKAETMDGDVEADESLGLKVVKTAAAKHLLGRLGDGSDPILIKVVNGDIKLKK